MLTIKSKNDKMQSAIVCIRHSVHRRKVYTMEIQSKLRRFEANEICWD